MSSFATIMRDIAVERARQGNLYRSGDIPFTCAMDVPESEKVTAMLEELGEVARAVNDEDHANLYVELIQVAAQAVAWCEFLSGAEARS